MRQSGQLTSSDNAYTQKEWMKPPHTPIWWLKRIQLTACHHFNINTRHAKSHGRLKCNINLSEQLVHWAVQQCGAVDFDELLRQQPYLQWHVNYL